MMIFFLYSLRNLTVRRLTTVLTAGGMGLVVFVFCAVLMLADGLEQALVSTGSPENVIFIRRSSETEVQSIIPRDQAAVIESLPDIEIRRDGSPFSAREAVILMGLNKKGYATASNVVLRGVDAETSFALRPQIRMVQGRVFRPGVAEIVLGKSIARRFDVGGLGDSIEFGGRSWTIVGIMDAGGSSFDSEVWADVDLAMSTFRRPVYSSITGRMRWPSEFEALKEKVLSDPRLTVEPWRETKYYAAQSALMARFIRILGLTLTIIFGIGAVIGSMVTMYAAVSNRVREIGTLRALGFGKSRILYCFLAEALLLSLLGGALGIGAASLLNRLTISTMNWQTFSELSFRFTLSSDIVTHALAFSVVMGLLGGALPSFRAARMRIVSALRQSA